MRNTFASHFRDPATAARIEAMLSQQYHIVNGDNVDHAPVWAREGEIVSDETMQARLAPQPTGRVIECDKCDGTGKLDEVEWLPDANYVPPVGEQPDVPLQIGSVVNLSEPTEADKRAIYEHVVGAIYDGVYKSPPATRPGHLELQAEIARLETENAKLRTALNDCKLHAEYGLGEWLGVGWVYLPAALSDYGIIHDYAVDALKDKE